MIKHSVLFLHDVLGTSADLTPLMNLIKGQGHDVFSFDFSGHGKSTPWPDEFRIDLFARDLDRFLKSREIANVVVVGHALGGYVALYYVANYEDSPIYQIFTYGTKFNWGSEALAKEMLALDPDSVSTRFPEYAEALRNKHGDRWKVLMRATAHLIQHLEKLDGLTKEDFADISIPVTLMLGDEDRLVTSEETTTTRDRLRGSSIKTIMQSKHHLERANLKEMAQVILDALD